jgi:hypothetical protein
MRVLCLEKNQFTGGMASTVELMRGYRFELAGSVQFPVPKEIYDDLGFDACPIFEPPVQSASISDAGKPPMIFYSDPDALLAHLGETLGSTRWWVSGFGITEGGLRATVGATAVDRRIVAHSHGIQPQLRPPQADCYGRPLTL